MGDKFKYLENFENWLKSIDDFDDTLFEKGECLYKNEHMNFAYACYRAGVRRGVKDDDND